MGEQHVSNFDNQSVRRFIRNSGEWRKTYLGGQNSWWKPFTTETTRSGVARYIAPIILYNSGIANASGLNPYGNNSRSEGVVHSNVPNVSSFITINPTGVRHLGMKTPGNAVGWGFDIHGYPYPNYNTGYLVSGMYGAQAPTGFWLGVSGASSTLFPASRGTDVPAERFAAGPVDLRFDPYRGLWTTPFGVMPCTVTSAYVDGTPNPPGGHFAKDIRYDVYLEDGVANQLRLTGVQNYGPHRSSTGYFVIPLTTGSQSLLMSVTISGKPQIVLYGTEALATTGCGLDESITVVSTIPNVFLPEDTIENYFILGISGSSVGSKRLFPGTGLSASYTSTGWTLTLNGVATVLGGVNTNITALSGLSVPLSIGQGGTGASGITFVGLTGTQSVSGIKIWQNQQRYYNGSLSVPSISFGTGSLDGFAYLPGATGLSVVNSGVATATFNNSGFYSRSNALFTNSQSVFNPGLVVQQSAAGNAQPFEVRDEAGRQAFTVGLSGYRTYNPSGYTEVRCLSATGINVLTLPSGGTVVNTAYLQQSFVWNEVPSGAVNGVTSGFVLSRTPLTSGTAMIFVNGLLQYPGTSEDYTISSATVLFNSSAIPTSGDKLMASYQTAVAY
jgi:hypothetical protein